ncbi:NAD-dependent epimerase/dehydratase family protein [bacterium]|nr:NAD-dependent epimerase/dehydratase family protein [bacterium]MBU1072170.1 NAD-dependent epimerase/dehydratase family protein [bacterium]MBU1675880.1 NAD-dependent epimerase/dehydratase family protein [bacterium]
MTRKVLVTGAAGFIGRNLCLALGRLPDTVVHGLDIEDDPADLEDLIREVDWVFHLAGVNRPEDPAEFREGNVDLTSRLLDLLKADGRRVPVVFTSSIQAERDNPYGVSKKAAEDILARHGRENDSPVFIYRLPNVFGKWSRPNYNTVVATLCHNISRGLPVQLSDRSNVIHFCYVDTVVRTFISLMDSEAFDTSRQYHELDETFEITLGDLHDLIVSFRDARARAIVPDFSDDLTRYMYSTYLSFLDAGDFSVPAEMRTDDRGWLFELVRSPGFGQIFVSQTRPGITRGDHYHDTKVEKFCVIRGRGVIRLRKLGEEEIVAYEVSDEKIEIVDIPPGYTHSIENCGGHDMITIFWANEIFRPEAPDTYWEKV